MGYVSKGHVNHNGTLFAEGEFIPCTKEEGELLVESGAATFVNDGAQQPAPSAQPAAAAAPSPAAPQAPQAQKVDVTPGK